MKGFNVCLLLASTVVLLAACTGTYDFGEYPYVKKPAVFSMINPDSLIEVRVFWNKPVKDTLPFRTIDGAAVEIEEDGSVVFSGETVDGVVSTEIYPSEGRQYRLRIGIEGLPEITATTSIPLPSRIGYSLRVNMGGTYSTYLLVDVGEIATPENVRSVWLSGNGRYEDGQLRTIYSDLYSDGPFLDDVNAVPEASRDAPLRESNINYESRFIRIRRDALKTAVPFTFAIPASASFSIEDGVDDLGYPNYKDVKLQDAVVYITSPSDEYDKYERTSYKHQLESDSFFINAPVNVYSNIENGIGIFAGYNRSQVSMPVVWPEN